MRALSTSTSEGFRSGEVDGAGPSYESVQAFCNVEKPVVENTSVNLGRVQIYITSALDLVLASITYFQHPLRPAQDKPLGCSSGGDVSQSRRF